MPHITQLWNRVGQYASHPDPRVEACNWIALVVTWNQPFYPLYLYWIVGERLTPVFLTFLSTPFFLAIPALSRRYPVLSRAMLPATGIANTMLSAKAFGQASGVEIFLIPCALIGAAFFRPSERIVGLSLVAISVIAFFMMTGQYGVPLGRFSPEEYQSMVSLNGVSAGTITIFIGILVSGIIASSEPPPPNDRNAA